MARINLKQGQILSRIKGVCRFCDNSLFYATKQCLLVCRFFEFVLLFGVALLENAEFKLLSA